jgi:hypothetical protein
MTNARVGLIVLFALTSFVFAQQGSPAEQSSSDPVKITAFPNGIFKFAQGKSNGSSNLQGEIAGCTTGTYDGSDPKSKPSGGAASTRVIDQIRKGAFWYTVFQTVLGSGCNVQGMCGAGSAVTVVWLKLDAKLKVISRKAVIVEDCMTDTGTRKFAGKTGDEIKDSFDQNSGWWRASSRLNFNVTISTRKRQPSRVCVTTGNHPKKDWWSRAKPSQSNRPIKQVQFQSR